MAGILMWALGIGHPDCEARLKGRFERALSSPWIVLFLGGGTGRSSRAMV
ncbi:MAG: hypothetical protein JW999_05860 [Methanotrichaceae archaeon]|nr:hypothetical protein [Methanotrichaceae archaeon]